MNNKRTTRLADFLLSKLNEREQEKVKGGEDIIIIEDTVVD